MMKERNSRPLAPLFAALALGVLAVGASSYFRPFLSQSDPSLLVSTETVLVRREAYGTVYSPRSGSSSVGFAFYPGARVPGDAYAYLGAGLAASGYTTVILSLPLNFAVFAPAEAAKAMRANPEIPAWALGGHSLGGAMAAAYAAKHPTEVAGLVLLASYPPDSASLASWGRPVLSVSASNDGLATQAKIARRRPLLPPATRYVEIAGGNHAQFGAYGAQPGDGDASLAPDAQRRAVTEETLALLDGILKGKR